MINVSMIKQSSEAPNLYPSWRNLGKVETLSSHELKENDLQFMSPIVIN